MDLPNFGQTSLLEIQEALEALEDGRLLPGAERHSSQAVLEFSQLHGLFKSEQLGLEQRALLDRARDHSAAGD